MSEKIITVDSEKIQKLVSKIFVASGLNKSDADTVADNLVQAEMRGIRSHGLVQVANYSTFMRNGKINVNADIKLLSESISTLAFDADFAPGAVAGKHAMERTLEKAKATGVAVATVKNGTHFGFAAYYALDAIKENMIGLAFTSSSFLVAPFGGYERVQGTNPICIAVPAKNKRPVVFDAATSNAAYNKSFFAYTEGRSIPDDWGLDSSGNKTTNPADIVKKGGALLPFGGYKGYGLGFIISILTTVLSGTAIAADADGSIIEKTNGIGFNFAAIDISRFVDVDAFRKTVSLSIDRIKQSKKQNGVEEIYIPGEIEWNLYEKSKKDGLVLYNGVASEITRTIQELGLDDSLENVRIG